MSSPQSPPRPTRSLSRSRVRDHLIEAILDAAQACEGHSSFFDLLLGAITDRLGSPYAALEYRTDANRTKHTSGSDAEDGAFWRGPTVEAIEAARSLRRPQVRMFAGRPGIDAVDLHVGILTAPLTSSSGSVVGAIGVVLPCEDREDAEEWIELLDPLAKVISCCAWSVGSDPDARPEVPFSKAALQETLLRKIGACANESNSRQEFYSHVLEAFVEATASPYAALEVRRSTEVIHQERESEATKACFWRKTTQSVLTEAMTLAKPRARLFTGKSQNISVALVSTPICDWSGSTVGAIALVVPCSNSLEAAQWVAILHPLTALAAQCADNLGGDRTDSVDMSAVSQLDSIRRAAEYSSLVELAFGLTNNLRTKTGCDQVALGLVKKTGVKIVSISGLGEVKHRSPGAATLRSAMDECLDLAQPIVYQDESNWESEGLCREFRLHRQWHESAGGAAVASIPLRVQEEVVAVLSMRRSADAPFSRQQLEELHGLVAPYIAALDMVDRSSRSLASHVVSSVRDAAYFIVRPEGARKKLTTVLLAAAIGWFLFGSVSYEVTVPCTVEPAEAQNLTTPFDAVLSEPRLAAGDLVRMGDVLCRFDSKDLVLEKQGLNTELAIFVLEERRALAEGSPIEAELARANQARIRARIEIVDVRLGRSVVRAPFDGIVVTGDLSERRGDVLQKGTPLFQVSPQHGWNLELHVREADVDDVAQDMSGLFASHARPERRHPLTVTRIRPSSEVIDGVNVFVAEADADIPLEWLLSGMEGTAKLDAGKRSPARVLFQPVLDFLHANFWL